MPIQIDPAITSWEVVKDDGPLQINIQEAKETKDQKPIKRSDILKGTTYKIKSPHSEAALYVTINDLDGAPFEIFFNSRDVSHYQWTTALSLLISAIFRKGGNIMFLVEELQSVFDPKGGFFMKGNGFVNSTVAAIGKCIEKHINGLGIETKPQLDERQKRLA